MYGVYKVRFVLQYSFKMVSRMRVIPQNKKVAIFWTRCINMINVKNCSFYTS